MVNVHKVAEVGFGSGTNDLYDRARPSYQPVALKFMRDSLREKGPINIAEIGAGTGIFTRALLADPEWNTLIKELRAIEPSQGMRDVFTRSVKDARVTSSQGVFDATGVDDGWADLVVIAQAFHWCPDYNTASAEFARILKPNGIVAFIWNLEDRDRSPWVAKIRDVIEVHEQGTPQFRHMLWRRTFDTPSYQEHFQPPNEKTWDYSLEGTKESVVDRASSKSYIAILPDDEKAKAQSEVRRIIDETDKVWIDKSKGLFEYPYKTWVVIAEKK